MLLPDNATLLFVGDSITDAGHDAHGEETPWNHSVSLGHGYVALVNAHLTAVHPERRVRVLNRGISGNTVRDLRERWERDVLAPQPDWVAVMIGINDVWRRFDCPLRSDHVSLAEYQTTLHALLERTRPRVRGLTVLAPYVIEGNAGDPMRQAILEYGAAARTVATAFGAGFVDTQAAFDAVLGHRHASALAWDRIHPGFPGHMVIARAFLQAIGA